MRPFGDVELIWKNTTYTIPSNRIMGAIRRAEQHLTLAELHEMNERGAMRLGAIATAYADLLAYAGAKVTDEEVYRTMFATGSVLSAIAGALNGLMGIMIPPADILTPEDRAPGKDQPTAAS
jgi:hypothetical protein